MSEKPNLIKDKSFAFAVSIVLLYKELSTKQHEYVLSKQLLKSGTSIGANVREALNAESKADFIHKLAIAQKECDETIYWLELLAETNFIAPDNSYKEEAQHILHIIRRIILSSKKTLKQK